jgi:hypothetical protein
MNKVIIASIVFLTTISFHTLAQSKSQVSDSTEVSNHKKTEVVVNMEMIEQYRKFMENDEYVPLAETIKNYGFRDVKGFCATYRNYEFADDTSYDDVKLAYEKSKNETEKDDKEESKEEHLYTEIQE